MSRFQAWTLLIGGVLSLLAFGAFYFEFPAKIDAILPAVLLIFTLVLASQADENRTATASGTVLLLIVILLGSFGNFLRGAGIWNWQAIGTAVWLLFAAIIGLNKVFWAMGICLLESTSATEKPGWKRSTRQCLGFLLIIGALALLAGEFIDQYRNRRALAEIDQILDQMKSQESKIKQQVDSLERSFSSKDAQQAVDLIGNQFSLAERGTALVDPKNEAQAAWQRRLTRIRKLVASSENQQKRVQEMIAMESKRLKAAIADRPGVEAFNR